MSATPLHARRLSRNASTRGSGRQAVRIALTRRRRQGASGSWGVRAYDLVRLAAARGVLRRRRIDHTPCGFADGPSPAPASFAFITAKIFGYVDGHDAV